MAVPQTAWTSPASALTWPPHGMNPMRVLQLAQAMGGVTARILLVGCEPETLGSDEEGLMGLSEAVAAAVEPAADIVEALVGKILEEKPRCGVTSESKRRRYGSGSNVSHRSKRTGSQRNQGHTVSAREACP